MDKETIKKIISDLPKDKRELINKKLYKIALLINSVECDLMGTELQNDFLAPDEKEFTLWVQFYNLEQMFIN